MSRETWWVLSIVLPYLFGAGVVGLVVLVLERARR